MSVINTISQTASNDVKVERAIKGMLIVPAIIIVFHLLIVAGIIPYTIVWGGRLNSTAEMLQFEAISIGINLMVLAVFAAEGGWIRKLLPHNLKAVLLWGLFGLFVANTVANLFSVTSFEKIVFTPITFLFAHWTYRVIQHRQQISS
ncbi:MAG: hypothetical protein AB8G95_29825 [Anaerolineae bacterium]